MEDDFQKYLVEAAKEPRDALSEDNPYKQIGFDGNQARLGWVALAPFSEIKNSLSELSSFFEGKENFIFVGMGGSINGIKPLLALFDKPSFYTIDSLDPLAVKAIIEKIKSPEKTLVISNSKSGTTKETQLITSTLKEFLKNCLGEDNLGDHFLWLTDKGSFAKLDTLGWEGAKKVSIQCNEKFDIGGRFSAPHTLIFLLPLFLLLDKNLNRLEEIYCLFASLEDNIQDLAFSAYQKYKDVSKAYFSPVIEESLGEFFSSWVVQLFQESLGSKSESLAVKTITNIKEANSFHSLDLGLEIENPIASLMCHMYYFQVFIAYYSAHKKINFVNQEFVEKYKQQMSKLEGDSDGPDKNKFLKLKEIIEKISEKISNSHNFIEVVLYFYPDQKIIDFIKTEFSKEFPEKQVLVFIGSDWNHQSYQAAFASKDTFFVLLTSAYILGVDKIDEKTLENNIKTLKLVAKATYLTITDKAVLFSFDKGSLSGCKG